MLMDERQAKRLFEAGQEVGERLTAQSNQLVQELDQLIEETQTASQQGDVPQAKEVDKTTREFMQALSESSQTLTERALEAQRLGIQLSQEIFESATNELDAQVQSYRAMVQDLASQTPRQQEAYRKFFEESAKAYSSFLNSVFSQYPRRS